MPDLLRRAAALTILAAVGIALLAPMAARSVAPVPADEIQALLPAAPIPVNVSTRGVLSDRRATAFLPVTGSAETVGAPALPTPASAPMEATLYPVATPKPTPAPRPPASSGGGESVPVDGSVWDRLAQCESGGNWAITSPNGTYMGGLQFNYGTWHAYGGGEFAEYPHHATREQQILIAERLHAARGFQPWPACRVKLGLP